MDKDIIQRYFFVGLLLGASVLVLLIFLPFLEVLVLSTVFGVVLTPLHRRITNELNGSTGGAAFIIILLFAIVIIVPFILLTIRVLSESKDIYVQLSNSTDVDYIQRITDVLETPIQRYFPTFSLRISEVASLAASFITSHLTGILSRVLSIVTGIVLMFISLFFFLRDGLKFKKILIKLSPLDDKYDELIFEKIRDTITVTVKGILFVAVIQGILAGIGMWLFGVPNYTLWGSISAVASLVPGLGTAIVFIPAVAYMYIIGNTASAVALLLWGVLIVGLVDNFLTPYLYSRGLDIHPLLTLFAVLGGIIVFGPIGFIFGPLVLALFFALIEIYQTTLLNKETS